MKLPRTILPWLGSFEAAARHMNFTRAAEELGITQGAMSLHVQRLEDALACKLFERRGRSVNLTAQGEAFMPHVSRLFEELGFVAQSLFDISDDRRVSIICYSPSFADLWLAPKLAKIYREVPDAEIVVSVEYKAPDLLSLGGDLTIAYGSGSMLGRRFIPLLEEHLTAFGPPDMQGWPETLSPETPLIQTIGPRKPWYSWLSAAGLKEVERPRFIHVNSTHALLAMVAEGAGIGLAAAELAEPAVRRGSIVALRPEITIDAGSYGLLLREEPSQRQVVQRVQRMILELANTTNR